jgi:hypothetical protein
MKHHPSDYVPFTRAVRALTLLVLLSTFNSQLSAVPMGTAFTYQGNLTDGTSAANGVYDFKFILYDDATLGTQQGPILATNGVAVANGYFQVTLDFGNTFPGDARWLDISVRTNGPGSYTQLVPRQALPPMPYAIMANSASNVLGTLPTAQLSGTVANGQLANNAITVNAGPGLLGGGAVPLGGATTLTNAGVLSVTGNADITAAPIAGNVALGSTATDTNTPGLIVKRDTNGSFSAGSVTLAGNLNLPLTTATNGAIYAGNNLLLHDYGSANFFAGARAGNLTMTGGENTGIGAYAFQSNTGGHGNSAYGCYALYANTIGIENSAIGDRALYFNTSGLANTASGFDALFSNQTGSYNTANGDRALYSNLTGSDNTANGVWALAGNTSGDNNTANGYEALYFNTSGGNNTANGYYALGGNTTGYGNTALGHQALSANTTGSNNLGLGFRAGFYLTTGSYNIDIGSSGVAGESQTIRIGMLGTQTNTFIAGIYSNTVPAGLPVYVDAAGQLGTGSGSPVALLNSNETFSGKVTFNNATGSFTGTFAGDGAGLTNLSASQVNAWGTTGNAGTQPGTSFLGTTDNQPLEFRVNNNRSLRLEYGSSSVNMIVNPSVNSVATFGSSIAGGAGNQIQTSAVYSVIAGGLGNQVQGSPDYAAGGSAIGGGVLNVIEPSGTDSVIGGGYGNRVQSHVQYGTLSGGVSNTISPYAKAAVISGGANNTASGLGAVVAGGGYDAGAWSEPPWGGNTASGKASTVGGGVANIAGGYYSTVAGGYMNAATNSCATVAGGEANLAGAYGATTAGGFTNTALGWCATVGGGHMNAVTNPCATVAGGEANLAGAYGAVAAGGSTNAALGWCATVGGGYGNTARGLAAFVGGGGMDPEELGEGNFADARASSITGGWGNRIQAHSDGAAIGGGARNSIEPWARWTTVSGGTSNLIQASADGATVAGGATNIVHPAANDATIGGGRHNEILPWGECGTIGGGEYNTAGAFGTVPGGRRNSATGDCSFAGGYDANAHYFGSFVWGGGGGDVEDESASQVRFRCDGGVFFEGVEWIGGVGYLKAIWWTPSSASWNYTSDRNLKEAFATVDAQAVLEKVVSLPLSEWSFKGSSQRHIGPMAQDFHAAFPLNDSDKTLNDADLHGVTLAAIQGLNQKLEAKGQRLEKENAELRARLEKLEQLLNATTGGNQ